MTGLRHSGHCSAPMTIWPSPSVSSHCPDVLERPVVGGVLIDRAADLVGAPGGDVRELERAAACTASVGHQVRRSGGSSSARVASSSSWSDSIISVGGLLVAPAVGVLALDVVLLASGSGRSGSIGGDRRVRRRRADVHRQVVVERWQALLEHAGGVAVVGDDVEAGRRAAGDQVAPGSFSRRVLPELTIQRIVGDDAVLGPQAVAVLLPAGVGQDLPRRRPGRSTRRCRPRCRTPSGRTTGRSSGPTGRS